MIFNSILIAVFIFSTVHALHQEMDSGFNPIATVDLVEDTDENLSLRGDHIKLAATNPITYRGGPVLTNPIPVYLLYYGTWSTSQIQIVNDFLGSLR